MRQTEFQRRFEPMWQACSDWLDRREQSRGARLRLLSKKKAPVASPGLEVDDFPACYRALCGHLALARERRYAPTLVDRLHALVVRGHHALYGASAPASAGFLAFVGGGFARLVRQEWRVVLLASALFFGPLLGLLGIVQIYPDFAAVVVGPDQLAQVQSMYDPDNEALGRVDAQSNFQMFGFYVWNNVRIGFQTFAGGVLAGLGSVFFLLFNGVLLGTIIGHLTQVGLGPQIWSFTAGHGSFELLAIAISGAAGLKLGSAVLAPGLRTRRAALVHHGAIAFRLIGGASLMFLVAAFIEAFWSPLQLATPLPKYLIGVLLWSLLLAYLLRAGHAPAPLRPGEAVDAA
jgi:uncharacterized membrane protein SpoIIM required for sporulation